MSVYKDANTGKYFCRFRIKDYKGKITHKSKSGFNTKKEAQIYELKYSTTHYNDLLYNMSLKDLYSNFIIHYSNLYKQSSLLSFNYTYKKYLKEIENIKVFDFTPDKLSLFQRSLLDKGTILSVNKAFSLLKRVFDFGVKFYNLENNVVDKIEKLNNFSFDSRVNYFTYKEYKHFISFVPDKIGSKDFVFYLAFQILYYTGLRTGELLALNLSDVNFQKNTIKVNKTLSKNMNGTYTVSSTKTFSSNSFVSIPKQLSEDIVKWVEYLKYINFYDLDNPLLLYNDKQISKRTLENKKNYYCKISSSKKIRLHDFRHSFASLIYELSDYNYSEVAKRLRHKDTSTVLKTYVHVFPSKKNEIDNKLNEL